MQEKIKEKMVNDSKQFLVFIVYNSVEAIFVGWKEGSVSVSLKSKYLQMD